MLRLCLLGELEAWRGDERLALPPSRKTRALLGYLTATGRAHRRERLCSMFWEIPDDPRGSLRWSLSRLRAIVDGPQKLHITANRESVGFNPAGADIDLLALRAAAAQGFDRLDTQTLAALAARFRGEFLEGLELPAQHEFQAWCLAEREDLRQLQISMLRELIERLDATPEAALPPLRQLIQIDPYNEAARLDLLRLLIASGREQEAERQFETAERQFRELGGDTAARFARHWRALRIRPAAAAGPAIEPPSAPLVVPAVRTAPRPAPALATAGQIALVGRDADRRRLAAAVDAVVRLGEAGVTLILGEPGMGKSRLIADALARGRDAGMRVLTGRAYDGAAGAAYAPWVEALERLPELGPAESLVAGRERLFAAVIAEVIGDGTTPVLVALDDMHWSDEASADLLHQLVRSSRHVPLCVVVAAREGEIADNATMTAVLRSLRHDGLIDELRLTPLSAEDTAALVATLATPDKVERIAELSGGNPLFAIELSRDLHAQDEALPTSLRELLRERVNRMPSNSAELLRWAAVLGSSFSARLLHDVVGLPPADLLQTLDLVERHGLLRPKGEADYAFTHDLVHRAVLTTLSGPRRRLMHLRVAEALTAAGGGETDALAVANHAAAGGDFAMAATACVAAARRALRIFAHAEVMLLVRSGFHYAESLGEPQRLQCNVELAEIEVNVSRHVERPKFISRLTELAERAMDFGRPDLARRCYTIRAHILWQTGEWQAARRDTVQAEFLSRTTDPRERVVALAEAARCFAMLERDLDQAEALVLEADALGRRHGVEPNAIADAMGLLRAHQGSIEDAETLFRHSREIARRDGEQLNEFLALEHLVTLQFAFDRADLVTDLCAELLDLARKLRPGSEVAFAQGLAAVATHPGQSGAATGVFAAMDALRLADAKHRLAVLATAFAKTCIAEGRPLEAQAMAEEALRNAEITNRSSDMAGALAVLVELGPVGAAGRDPVADRERLNELCALPISAAARAAAERAILAAANHPERLEREAI
jgi:DNA-binding SARP family transcriptional activator